MSWVEVFNNILELKKYRRDPIKFFVSQYQRQGLRWTLKLPGWNGHIMTDKESIQQILKDHSSQIIKGRTTQKMQKVLGQGLITSEGELWKNQNKKIRPFFTTKAVQELLPQMIQVTNEEVRKLRGVKTLDVGEFFHQLSLKIIVQTIFNYQLDNPDEFILRVSRIQKWLVGQTRSLLALPAWVPMPQNLEFTEDMKYFKNVIREIIDHKIHHPSFGNDFVDSMRRDFSSSHQSPMQLLEDEMITLLMAGHETVATQLSWTVIELLKNSNHLNLITQFLQGSDRTMDDNFYMEHDLLSSAIYEGLRLHPPVWAMMREARSNFSLEDGYRINQGDQIIFSSYISQRAGEYWDQPEQFIGDRFIARPPQQNGSFFPFGYGPRICLGQHFAIIEAKVILYALLSQCKMEFSQYEPQTYEANIIYKPTNNLKVNIKWN